MAINVRTLDIQITARELGLTRDRFTRSLLRQNLENKLNSSIWNTNTVSDPLYLQSEIDNFAERLAAGCLTNVQNYFSKLGMAGYTAGGRRASSQPMLYDKKQLLPSSEDIGAIGEGVAGWYLETHEGLAFEVRPFGVSPDFVFRKPRSGDRVLVEVKTSLHSGRSFLSVAVGLLDILAKTKFIRKGKYFAYVVQVSIISPDQFNLERVGMEEI